MSLRMHERIQCVNCNICVNACNTFRRHAVLQLDPRVVSLINNWVSPVIITEEDYICDACFCLSMQIVNAQLHGDEYDRSAGPSLCGHTLVCLLCGRTLVNRQSHHILRQNTTDIIQRVIQIIENKIAPRQLTPSDHTCHACWMQSMRDAVRNVEADKRRNLENVMISGDSNVVQDIPRHPTSPDVEQEELFDQELPAEQEPPPCPEPDSQEQTDNLTPEQVLSSSPEPDVPVVSNDIVLPNYRRGPNTASHCLFYGCDRVTNLHQISDPLRVTILHIYNYYIPNLARICSEHLQQNNWDSVYDSENSISSFTAQQVEHIFSFVHPSNQLLDFSSLESVQNMDDHLFGYWIGLNKSNFIDLIRELPRILEIKRGILGAAALLIKMRTGDSDERLATLLDIPRSSLERLMGKVREIFLQDFVPRNLGLNHLTREQSIEHNLTVPNGIYNQNNCHAIVMCDGTYIYINKSSNYMFQKDSYSLHKYRNLLKPFMLVLCDGYILDCFGPYKATTSDADIMISLFSDENSPVRRFFQENDKFILDRGFRDSISLLESCNYKAYMPESLMEGEHQLTTAQANRSRCVTICRWVVEVVNGYFKRDYRLLRFDHFNKTVPNMMAYFQIAAALINKFGVRLQDRADASQIINIIRERMPLQNNLSVLCVTSPSVTVKIGLVQNNLQGREAIKEYFCNCIMGRLTVGCCAHVMTLVWFLGWARHQDNIVPPAAFLDDVVVREDFD
ncbi:hypothetical protein evm_014038 [Chilo suppressalis]|nr:hypothetical protein evm_014038 [Chilo suppressalis]